MLRVFADDHYMAFSLDDFALFANLLYGWLYFHCITPVLSDNYFARQVIRPLSRS